MNGRGKIKLAPGARIIQLPICSRCRVVVSGCKCGAPNKRPAA